MGNSGMHEAKEHIRPGVPRDGPLGVGNGGRSSIDGQPIGRMGCFHQSDGRWGQLRQHVS
eukprot:4100291-Alexandrium_andersonii.AAC.1